MRLLRGDEGEVERAEAAGGDLVPKEAELVRSFASLEDRLPGRDYEPAPVLLERIRGRKPSRG